MPLINPTLAQSLTWGQWLKQSLLHPSLAGKPSRIEVSNPDDYDSEHISSRYATNSTGDQEVKVFYHNPFQTRVSKSNIIKGAFLETYEFDGYDTTTNTTVTAFGATANYAGVKLSLGTALAMFLGLPNRASTIQRRPDQTPELTLRQVIRNYFGGWNPIKLHHNTKKLELSGKQIWNVLALPVKILLILPIKIAGTVFKTLLNTVKLFTEFLPSVIMNGVGSAARRFSSAAADGSTSRELAKTIAGIVATLIAIPLLALHTAARIISTVGRALTSPEKSARMAWAWGRTLNSKAGYVLATAAAAMSVALTVALWAIALPLVVGITVTAIPQLLPLLTQLAQIPVVASSLAMVNGTLTAVSASVAAAFAPAVAALSSLLGIQVSAMALAVGTTLGVIAAPVTTIASRIADDLSNGWARWNGQVPLTSLSKVFRRQGSYSVPIHSGSTPEASPEASPQASPQARRLADNAAETRQAAQQAGNFDFDAQFNRGAGQKPPATGTLTEDTGYGLGH